MPNDSHDVIRSGAELVIPATGRWITPSDVSASLVVFVHGFTSHGRYMAQLADHVGRHGFTTALFNYDSYRGIDEAAHDLARHLTLLQEPLKEHGVALIAHSMGGLVARWFATTDESATRDTLRGIATLGTPHDKTLSRRIVSLMLDWADYLTSPNPFARSGACRSAKQLVGSDDEALIATLNRRWQARRIDIPMCSMSAGLPFLEFGPASESRFTGMLRNRVLQFLIHENPNDGLVGESSADVTRHTPPSHLVRHKNDYHDFPRINHTYLVRHQEIAAFLVQWLRETVFVGR